jgi:signal transduction histidine kinase
LKASFKTSSGQFGFPVIDLVMLGALLVIGWAGFRLAKTEPKLSRDSQEAQECQELFHECQELFRASLRQPELARRESDLAWQEKLRLKAEYFLIAERIESQLADLDQALQESTTSQIRPELQQKLHALKHWIARQNERVGVEPFAARSRELKERIALSALPRTNGTVTVVNDLASLLKEIEQTYEKYLAEFKVVTNNVGQPLVGRLVAEHRERASKAIAQLSDLAREARQDGKAIESFLEAQSASATASRTRRQETVIQAFLEAASSAEFTRRVREEPAAGQAAKLASGGTVSSLRQVRYGLWATLACLGVTLVVALYRRTVVMPLRVKLNEKETLIEHQKKLAHFEELAAGLAHEIRNPLTTMSARLYTVQRKLQAGTLEHKDAGIIGSEIERVSQIVKDFIQLTRPAPPKLELLTAAPLLQEVCDLMAPQVQRHSARLECRIEGDAQFKADPQQIKQVLINLIQNAAESMDKGGAIILRACNGHRALKGAPARVVSLEIEDNGPGIPPEVRARLFDPFFSTKRHGTGLGLSISARIVQRHGGSLDFETEPGRGSIFRIVLPAYEAG